MNTERINQILAEYGIENVEALTFSITDKMTEDELKNAIVEMQKDPAPEPDPEPSTEPAAEPASDPAPAVQDEYALTMNTKYTALSEAIYAFSNYTNEDSEYFYMMDFDDKYVYARCDRRKGCGASKSSTCRFTYAEADSKVVVDRESYEEVVVMFLTAEEATALDQQRNSYSELLEFKNARIEEDRKKELAEVITEFTDLVDIDEYKATVSNSLEFASADAFREKLYAIRGKYGTTKPHAKKVEDVRIPIGFSKPEEEKTYEQEFFAKYLHK